MVDLQEKVDLRIVELRKIIQTKESAVKKAPHGVLNVHNTEGRLQYYYKENTNDTVRRYLRTNEKKLVKELCQKDYDQRVLLAANKELKILEKLQKIYRGLTCEEVYELLHIHRKKHVTPIKMPDDEYIEEWEAFEYEPMSFSPGYPEYYSDKGERVRSKSEIIIANTLKNQGIPYRYECPLYLEDYVTFHPDFTVLNVRTREEKYFEHFGMMDDPEYAEAALKKIETYEKNGIFIGENLIATFESRRKPLNQKIVNQLIERYLK